MSWGNVQWTSSDLCMDVQFHTREVHISCAGILNCSNTCLSCLYKSVSQWYMTAHSQIKTDACCCQVLGEVGLAGQCASGGVSSIQISSDHLVSLRQALSSHFRHVPAPMCVCTAACTCRTHAVLTGFGCFSSDHVALKQHVLLSQSPSVTHLLHCCMDTYLAHICTLLLS